MSGIHSTKSVTESLKEYARGIAGGLLFSFPLLYTMEVWWAGFIVPPHSLLILVFVTFLLLLGYNRFSGMHPDSTWREVAIDSMEELGLGLITSCGILFLLNRINGSMAVDEVMGKVIIEAMAVSIGLSIGTSQLGAGNGGGKVGDRDPSEQNKVGLSVLAVCGALVVGANVAPTEEIVMIALEAEPHHILFMAILSLLMSVVILYFSNFRGSVSGMTDDILYEFTFDIALSYVLALGTAAFLLWFFGRFANMSFWFVVAQCVVLGVMTTLGASAGRLLIR